MKSLLSRRLLYGGAIALIMLSMSCGGIGYLASSGYQQARILWQREKIERLLKEKNLNQRIRERFELAAEIRNYAKFYLNLKVDRAYTSYVDLKQDALSWLLVAVKPDSFETKRWHFPIVGQIPYKGFFSKEDALKEAGKLRELGYEISIRPVTAYSSLGYFNDPLLSTFIHSDELAFTETILHELAHRTFWKKNDAVFNEGLAHFFGLQAALLFYKNKLKERSVSRQDCLVKYEELVKKAKKRIERSLIIAERIVELYKTFSEIFNSNITAEEKIHRKKEAFELWSESWQKQEVDFRPPLTSGNNAELMQTYLYYHKFPFFSNIFDEVNGDLKVFWNRVTTIK
ncbi:MAG TPA: aminopeptidase [Oligoflexia bacterium]|nr:aminopeptidase [Oligoflexia bacterium]HMP26416.1 aminopeptidase [Oligoflexia bacterium]